MAPLVTDPRFAPKRNDLPWLRRRVAPKPAAAAPVQDFLSGRTHGEHHHQPAAAASASGSSGSLDLDEPVAPAVVQPPAPASSSSLHLDEPAAPAGPAPAPASSSSLDLDEPAAPAAATAPPAAPASSSSLDLDETPPPPRPTPPASTSRRRTRVDRRVAAGERIILTPTDPTVTLTRLQSGIGTLTIEAAASSEVGDLRLGCAYELDDDLEMTMQMAQGNRFAPPHSKRPVLLGSRERFERVAVDLRQVLRLRRFVVYAFSEAKQPLTWGGTLVVTTFGNGRIELPLETLQGGDVAVLLSVYQVRGELVLRAEMQTLYGDVREAARAYGYDKITWLDDRSPVE